MAEATNDTDVALAEVHFPDGSIRTAWRDDDGRQYVVNDEGEPVFGVWSIEPNDTPFAVQARPES